MPPDIGRSVSPPRLEYGSRDPNPPMVRQTHPRELIIHPHEVDFRLPPYEPRPLAQHLIIPVSGKFIFFFTIIRFVAEINKLVNKLIC